MAIPSLPKGPRSPSASMSLVGLLFFLMGASIAAAAWASSRRADQGRWVQHAHEVLTQTERTRSRLFEAQAEAQSREIRLRGDHRERLARVLRDARSEVDALERLTAPSAAHRDRLRSLRLHWGRYAGEVRRLTDTRRSWGRAAELGLSSDATRAFGRALESLDRMRDAERRLLDLRRAEWERSVRLSDWAVAASGGAMVLAIAGLVGLVRSEAAARGREGEAVWERMGQLRDLSLRIPVAAVHVSGDQLRMNEAAQRLTGFGAEEVPTVEDWFRLTRRERAEEARKVYEAEREAGFGGASLRRIWRKDGEARHLEFAGYSDGTGEVWIFHDVTERVERGESLEEANRTLARLSETDALTGLKNRRAFDERSQGLFADSAQAGRPMSVLMLDVDRFKSVNDRFGHHAGDEALRGIARVLAWATRDGDLVARYGGEEFALLLPGLGERDALAVAERIRRAVEETPFGHGATTVSVGVATLGDEHGSVEGLVDGADRALYEAKHGGRNRVCAVNEIVRRG